VSSGGADEVSSWVRELNRHARRPDLSLVLSVDAAVARERRDVRSGKPEIYELDEMQRKLATFYETIDELFPSDTIRYIDANRAAESVADLIWAELGALPGESE